MIADFQSVHADVKEIFRPRIVKSMSLMSNARGFCINTIGLIFDLMSIVFVLDTKLSDHICKNKELFVGDIAKLDNVKLQVKGYAVVSNLKDTRS